MLDFLGLPREIRDMIYENALCIDGVLAPYKEHWKVKGDYDGPPPTVALFVVNKQIQSEAAPILIGKNTWRITSVIPDYIVDARRTESGVEYMDFFERYGEFFRNVTLNYDYQANTVLDHHVRPEDRMEMVEDVHEKIRASRQDRMVNLHDYALEDLRADWEGLNDVLQTLTNLASIAINIENLYCPFGCCRLEVVEQLLTEYLLETRSVEPAFLALSASHIAVVGAKNQEERALIEDCRKRRAGRVRLRDTRLEEDALAGHQ